MLTKEEQDSLIRTHYKSVNDYCRFRLKDAEAAKDVTQDTFALMIEKAARLTNDHMKQWLVKVAENKCNAYLRKQRRELKHKRFDELEPEELNRVLAKLEDRSFGVYYEVYQSIIMKHLSSKDALLCELRFVKGLSSAEIAEILNIQTAAVNTRISRLKKRIEKIIREDIPFL